jgi:ankyrin repeat protein
LSKGANLEVGTNAGKTALHFAVVLADEVVVEMLIGQGADLNARENDGWTALHYAVECG